MMDPEKVRHYFERFCQKIQTLLSQHHRSRHVVFTTANIRLLYTLYISKVYECTIYKNHHFHLCIIYDREKVIAMDINTRYPSPTHAEINAIQTMKKSGVPPLAQYGIFTIRFSKTSILNHSPPCFFCARSLRKHIHYFHSISFTDADETMVVLSPTEFLLQEFPHKTLRHRRQLFS